MSMNDKPEKSKCRCACACKRPCDSHTQVFWPGDTLRKAGEVVKDPKKNEVTKIPEIR